MRRSKGLSSRERLAAGSSTYENGERESSRNVSSQKAQSPARVCACERPAASAVSCKLPKVDLRRSL